MLTPHLIHHNAFQVWKTHPFIANILKGGKLVEYGAKRSPKAVGIHCQSSTWTMLMIVGDSAGFLAMPALKGIHLGVASGMQAAKTAAIAFSKNDFTENTLKQYDDFIRTV